MNGHTVRRGIGFALALSLTFAGADRAFAVTTQCVGCFAAVDGNGNARRSHGVASAKKIQDGVFEVVFSKLVTKCAFTATPGFTSAAAIGFVQPTMASAVGDASKPNTGVIVQLYDKSGALTNLSGFFLTLTCLPN